MINAGFGTDIDRCVFWKGREKKKVCRFWGSVGSTTLLLHNKALESWGWHHQKWMKVQWRSECLSGGVVYTVWHNCLPRAISLCQHEKQIAGLKKKKKKGREGGNLPEWGIDFVWPRRVLHSWSRQQEGSETCFTNRRAKAPMQNYFLTAPGKITHSSAPFFFLLLYRWHNTFQSLVTGSTSRPLFRFKAAAVQRAAVCYASGSKRTLVFFFFSLLDLQ